MSITRKIFAITFLVASLAVALMALLTLSMGQDVLRDLGRRRLVEAVGREAQLLQSRLDILRDDVAMLANQDTLRRLAMNAGRSDSEVQRGVLRQLRLLMEKRPDYREAAVLLPGESEDRLLSVWREPDGLMEGHASDRGLATRYPTRAEALATWPGSVHVALLAPEPPPPGDPVPPPRLAQAATRLPNGAGQAMLLVTVDMDALLAGLAARDDIALFVTDRFGGYLTPAQDDRGGSLPDRYGLHQSWDGWLAQHDPRYYVELNGGSQGLALRRVVVGDPMHPTGARHLVVGGVGSLADVESEALRLRNQLVGWSVGLGALLAAMLALAIAWLAQPLHALARIAGLIAEGQRDVTFPRLPNDEIGRLAEVMQRMLDALRIAAKNEEQAAMGRMASMIAHDVRNALSSVKMNFQILAEQRCVPGCGESCRIGLRQVAYMENVLDDMLAYARPDDLRLDWVDVGELIRTALVSMLPETAQKDIRVSEGERLSALPKILGDRTKLLRVLQNLIANAVQAMAPGGRLAVTAYPVLHDSSPAVEIVVADDGQGVPPEVAGRVFEPFFTTRAKGTGLGLAIVQRIVRAHGGAVALAPRLPGGTEVTLVLPVSAPSTAA